MEKPFPEQTPADFGKGQGNQPRSHHLHAVSIIPGKIYLPFPWVKASVLLSVPKRSAEDFFHCQLSLF